MQLINETVKKYINKFESLSVGAKASIVYTLASLISRGLAIITVPIFTRMLTTSEIGVVNLYGSWYGIIITISTLALTSGGYMLAMKEYSNERDSYDSSVLTLTTGMGLLFFVLILFFGDFFQRKMSLDRDLLLLMAYGTMVSPAIDFWLSRQRYEYKYKKAAFYTIISAVIASVVSIVAVIVGKRVIGCDLAKARLFSNSFIMYGIATIFWLRIIIKGRCYYSIKYWAFSLKLSIPLIIHTLASQVLSLSDRVMIGNMVGNSEVGIYGTLYTASSLCLIVWSAINSSFVPFLFENIDKKEMVKAIKSVSIKILIGFSIVAVTMTLLAPEIIMILATREYYEAIYIMPSIAAGVFMTSVSNLYSNILVYYKKTSYIMISSIAAALLNVTLNYWGIPIWGYKVAAITTLISYVLLAIIQAFVANIVCAANMSSQFPYNNIHILLCSLTTIVVCLSVTILYELFWVRWIIIILITVLLLVFRKRILGLITRK